MGGRARRLTSLAASAAVVLGGTGAPTFAAAPTRPASLRVIDGEPTGPACAAYGYDGRWSDVRSLSIQNRYSGVVPPPPPPPPPPFPRTSAAPPLDIPAPPAVKIAPQAPGGYAEKRLDQSVVVTGSRQVDLPGRYSRPPGAVETERYPDAKPNSVKQVAEAPVSTFSIDVDTASYSNVRRFLNEGSLPPRDAVRVEELINYFDYDYPRPIARTQPFRTFVSVAPSPWASGKQIVHLAVQGYTLPRAEKPPLNLTFLVDVSGSMESADRLPLAKQSLNLLIDRLRPQDKVSMVVYAGAAGTVLEPSAGTDKLKIRCAVENLAAGGSTAGGRGLARAYSLAKRNYRPGQVNRVILMTDGDFNVGVADPSKLEDFVAEQRKTGIYLSVYGFGRGNYQDLRMQAISQAGNGTAAYVDGLQEARKLFEEDFTRQVFPIADDVKIQVEFNPARVSEYRLIGYETRLLNREDFNNDQVDAGEVGAGASVTALYEITPVGGRSSVDALRYQSARPAAAPRSGEIAFLRLRYKAPGARTSVLAERPITDRDVVADLNAAPEQTRWAVAVAAYGQKLRGDPYMNERYDWRQIAALADSARGDDPIGLRAEFIGLVDKASNSQTRIGRR